MTAHCRACGQTFGGVRGFDQHLRPLTSDGQHGGCYRGDALGLRRDPAGVWRRPAPSKRHKPDPGASSAAPEGGGAA